MPEPKLMRQQPKWTPEDYQVIRVAAAMRGLSIVKYIAQVTVEAAKAETQTQQTKGK